jgi:hypothetical protein
MLNVGSDMFIPFSGYASAGVVLEGHRNGRRDVSPSSAIPACEMAGFLTTDQPIGKGAGLRHSFRIPEREG